MMYGSLGGFCYCAHTHAHTSGVWTKSDADSSIVNQFQSIQCRRTALFFLSCIPRAPCAAFLLRISPHCMFARRLALLHSMSIRYLVLYIIPRYSLHSIRSNILKYWGAKPTERTHYGVERGATVNYRPPNNSNKHPPHSSLTGYSGGIDHSEPSRGHGEKKPAMQKSWLGRKMGKNAPSPLPPCHGTVKRSIGHDQPTGVSANK